MLRSSLRPVRVTVPAGRRLRLPLAPVLVTVAMGALLTGLLTAVPTTEPLAGQQVSQEVTLASVALTDHTGGRALFTAERLVPGDSRVSCLSVSSTGAEPDDQVRLLARDVAGDLAAQLDVTVEVGTGGGGNGCAGFVGSPVWTSSLAELAAVSTTDSGVATGWQPAVNPDRTFRITVQVGDGAQQDSTTVATFVWALLPARPGGTGPTPAPPTTSPDVTPDLIPVPSPTTPVPETGPTNPAVPVLDGPTPGPTSTGSTRTPTLPSVATASPIPPSDDDGRPGLGLDRPGTPPVLAAPDTTPNALWSVLADIGRVAQVAAEVAKGVAHNSGFPLLLLLAVAVFLFIQHHLDRLDPKLALAPVQSDPHLIFDDARARPARAERAGPR